MRRDGVVLGIGRTGRDRGRPGRLAVLRGRVAARIVAALAGWALLAVAGCASPGSSGSPDSAGSAASSGAAGGSASTGAGHPTGGTSDAGSGSGSLSEQLAGRTFLSTSVDGHRLVAGSTVRIEFIRDGQVRASAGCNSLSGRAEWSDDILIVQQFAATEMGCDTPLMDQDAWLAGLLGSGLRADLDGDALTLTGDGTTVHLADRRVVDPDRPLQGTTWILDAIISGTGPSATVSSVPEGITATLRIADGKIQFFDGVNEHGGPTGPGAGIVVGADTVQIRGDIAGTAVGCEPEDACSVDMSVLTQDFRYRVTARQLTVTGTGDMAGRGLMFVARDDTEGPGGEPPVVTGSPASPAPGDRSVPPTRSAPQVSPGAATELTSQGGPRPSMGGGHDSIPPQPSPQSQSQPDG
jgi:heat shock protein HslJ